MTTSFLKTYKVLEKLGEGSFSDVLKCQHRETGTLYAAKRLKKIKESLSEVLQTPEVVTMRKLKNHGNILQMIESHYDPLPGKVTMIFELMDMSLYDLIRNRKRCLSESRVKNYLYQILRGVEHLHKHGLFHRDIKPENILLKVSSFGQHEVVKLADFGSVRGSFCRHPFTEYISTRWYRSPECLLTAGYYGPKMDIWAVGCVFYELLTLKPLFPGANELDQIHKINNIVGTPSGRVLGKFRKYKSRNCDFLFQQRSGVGLMSLLPNISEGGAEVLKNMIVYDPDLRSNVKRLLEHRYFNDLRIYDQGTRKRPIPVRTGHPTELHPVVQATSFPVPERKRMKRAAHRRTLEAGGKQPRASLVSPTPHVAVTHSPRVAASSVTEHTPKHQPNRRQPYLPPIKLSPRKVLKPKVPDNRVSTPPIIMRPRRVKQLQHTNTIGQSNQLSTPNLPPINSPTPMNYKTTTSARTSAHVSKPSCMILPPIMNKRSDPGTERRPPGPTGGIKPSLFSHSFKTPRPADRLLKLPPIKEKPPPEFVGSISKLPSIRKKQVHKL